MASGAKMGKTEKGAVWLDKKLFSFMNIGNFGGILISRDVKNF